MIPITMNTDIDQELHRLNSDSRVTACVYVNVINNFDLLAGAFFCISKKTSQNRNEASFGQDGFRKI